MEKKDEREGKDTKRFKVSFITLIILLITAFLIIFSGTTLYLLDLMSPTPTTVKNKIYYYTEENGFPVLQGEYIVEDYKPDLIIDFIYPFQGDLNEAFEFFDVITWVRVVEVNIVKLSNRPSLDLVVYKVKILKIYKGDGTVENYREIYVTSYASFNEYSKTVVYNEDTGFFNVGDELILFLLEDELPFRGSAFSKYPVYEYIVYYFRVENDLLNGENTYWMTLGYDDLYISEFEEMIGFG